MSAWKVRQDDEDYNYYELSAYFRVPKDADDSTERMESALDSMCSCVDGSDQECNLETAICGPQYEMTFKRFAFEVRLLFNQMWDYYEWVYKNRKKAR